MSSQAPLPRDQQASHPGLIETRFNDGDYASYAVSAVDLPSGAVFATFEGATRTAHPTYATVQTGKDSHMLLNSDLLYTNHSCKPNLEFDTDKMEVRVGGQSELKAGDKLTFFYPSTEWDMSQPFDCECGEQECLGRIDGAKNMSRDELSRYWLNKHIRELLAENGRP